jgi:cytochrome P450
MRRYVEEHTTLSNGISLDRGTRVYVDSSRMWDPDLHPHPEQWDGYRFLAMRSTPGKEKMAQLVSTAPDHLAFGYGRHACPGRFLAATEIKIVLCHFLLKYDCMLSAGTDVKPVMNGILANGSSTARVLIRRRSETGINVNAL